MEPLALALLGLGAGVFGVMVGAGGGIIMAPVLLLFSDLEPTVVAGTSLALVSVNSFSGTLAYRPMRLADRRSGLLFAAAAIPGSVAAPFVVRELAPDLFRAIFGLLLLGLAVHMLWRRTGGDDRPAKAGRRIRRSHTKRRVESDSGVYEYEFNEGLATGFNAILGFISAFLGTGGGFLRTPVLVAAFGFPVRVAVATSVFALSIYATVGATVHAGLGHLDWYPTFVWAGVGFLMGSQIGARLAGNVPTVWLIRLLAAVLLAMGGALLAQAAGV